MKKKIKDLTADEIPTCWSTVWDIDEVAGQCLLMSSLRGKEAFEKAKGSIPSEVAEKEIEVE